jgi:glycyl-tRNA synthetase beta chain
MNQRPDGSTPPTAGQSLPLLLEVGSEEIPARFIPGAIAALGERCAAGFGELNLAHSGLQVFGTPRRLAVLVDEIAVSQPDRHLQVKGPPLDIAFDADGKPTPAATGFARKNRVELSDCVTVEQEGREYLSVQRTDPGRPAVEVLAEKLPEIVLGLPFPKVMRWGDGPTEYTRPLRWVVALLGEQVIPLTLGPLAAGRQSRGHRFLAGDRPVDLASPAGYLEQLRQNGVIVDPEERRRQMEDGIAAALAGSAPEGDWTQDPELILENVHLCENPTPLLGRFGREYFELR